MDFQFQPALQDLYDNFSANIKSNGIEKIYAGDATWLNNNPLQKISLDEEILNYVWTNVFFNL